MNILKLVFTIHFHEYHEDNSKIDFYKYFGKLEHVLFLFQTNMWLNFVLRLYINSLSVSIH